MNTTIETLDQLTNLYVAAICGPVSLEVDHLLCRSADWLDRVADLWDAAPRTPEADLALGRAMGAKRAWVELQLAQALAYNAPETQPYNDEAEVVL